MTTDVAGEAAARSLADTGVSAAKKLSKLVLVGYGAGTVIGDWVWALFYAYFLFFMTGQMGVNPAIAGTMISVSTIVCAFSVPIMGIYSDTRTWKSGRRGPFILWGGFAMAIAFVLLFVDTGLSGSALIVYLFIMVILVQVAYGAQAAPYGAMVPELTLDYDERTTLTSVRGIFTSIIVVVGHALPLAAVAAFTGWFAISEKSSWTMMVAIVTVIALALNVFCWATTHKHELMPPVEKQKLSDILRAAIKNRSFRTIAVMYAVNAIGQSVFALMSIYFLFDYLGMGDNSIALFFLVVSVSGVFWVPLNGWIAQKLDKRQAMYIAGMVTLVSCLLMLFVTPGNAWLMWVLSVTATMGMMGAVVVPMSMLADCVEIDQYRSGTRREGLFYSAAVMLMQLFAAAAIWITGMVLNWTGYDGTAAVQSSSAIWGIRLLETLVMGVTSGLTVILAWRVPLTREKFAAVMDAMEAKKKGEPVDESSFADLF